MRRAIVFGAGGALGSAVVTSLLDRGWDVDRAGRRRSDGIEIGTEEPEWTTHCRGTYSGLVWAQGMNSTGGVLEADDADYARLFDANVAFIPRTLRELDRAGRLAPKARGVILSSIWQVTARSNKAAYVVSKAALGGLVAAMAADLDGRLAVNAVLPGVIDTPMTRTNLSADQIQAVETATPGGRLARPHEVGAVAAWLVDPAASGVNGQSIAVDNGWTAVRHV